MFVDSVTGNIDLIWWHLLGISFFGFIYASYSYLEWIKYYKTSGKELHYNVRLDESGVYLQTAEIHHGWDYYLNYIEHDEYLEINGKDGVSFLPKTDELQEVVEFTKAHITEK